MNLPKTVAIAGRDYTVKSNKSHGGGSFQSGKCHIEVGTAFKKDIPGIFLHEVAEAILAERNLRYRISHTPPTNGDYMFVFNHQQFEDFIFDLAYALKPYLK